MRFACVYLVHRINSLEGIRLTQFTWVYRRGFLAGSLFAGVCKGLTMLFCFPRTGFKPNQRALR
jgi:hypothetical protein